jgi:hypothetical protein
MSVYRVATAIVPATVALALMMPTIGYACDCLRLRAPSTAMRTEAHFIFSGRVVEVVERNEHTTTIFERGATTSVRPLERRIVFEVAAGWRGVSRRRLSVIADSGDCMFPFEVGGEYLVFANRDAQGRAWTSICSRTTDLKSAAEIMRQLGTPLYRPGDASRRQP